MKKIVTVFCLLLSAISFGQHVPPADSTSATTEVESNVQFFAPNAFTPDGDFYNDTWKVYIDGIDIYDFHLTIFDRSGQVIWESYNAIGEWDGNYGDFAAQDGIYPYIVETKDAITDKRYQFTGFITLLR